jgi:hypothetical protein
VVAAADVVVGAGNATAAGAGTDLDISDAELPAAVGTHPHLLRRTSGPDPDNRR